VQTNFAASIGQQSASDAHDALYGALRWAWKVAIVLVALFARPAAVHGAAVQTGIRQQASLAFNFTSAANQTAELAVAADGSKTVEVTDNDETAAMTLSITGRADESEIDFLVSSERDVTIALRYESGESVAMALTAPPDGAIITLTIEADGALSAAIIDPTYDRAGVSVTMTAVESDSALDVVFDELPAEEAAGNDGRVTPRFPGFVGGEALGGSVTLSAAGLSTGGIYVVSLFYAAADVAQSDESDLRVHRFENSTGAFEPIGTNGRGNGPASSGPNDYGVDLEQHAAWGVTDQLGTFAVGISDDTLAAIVEDDDVGSNGLGGAVRGICGAMGTLGLLPLVTGLIALRARRIR